MHSTPHKGPAIHDILEELYHTRIQNVHIEETIRYDIWGSSKNHKIIRYDKWKNMKGFAPNQIKFTRWRKSLMFILVPTSLATTRSRTLVWTSCQILERPAVNFRWTYWRSRCLSRSTSGMRNLKVSCSQISGHQKSWNIWKLDFLVFCIQMDAGVPFMTDLCFFEKWLEVWTQYSNGKNVWKQDFLFQVCEWYVKSGAILNQTFFTICNMELV